MGVPGAPSRRAARSRREPRHPWVPKAAARRYDHMVPPSEFEVSHSLSPSSATAASLLSCLHSAPGLSAPATMPPGLLPAGTAAWPPALSSAARAARSPAAKRSLPTLHRAISLGLQPAGGAGPPPPVAASDLSAEARTPWIVFILDDCTYFSPNITNHLDHFHLLFPPRIRYSLEFGGRKPRTQLWEKSSVNA